jgi:hypothetical protein
VKKVIMKQEISKYSGPDPTLEELKAIVQCFESFGINGATKIYVTTSDSQRDGKTISFRAGRELQNEGKKL